MQQDTTNRTCLNCGAELHGKYCHICGQHSTDCKPTVKEFILEYLNNAFMWDTHFIKTLRKLVRRPGLLTNEYVSGKYVSYMHPLKLSMFLLFAFLTIFLFFRDTEDLNKSLHTFTRNETAQPIIKVELLVKDAEYNKMIMASHTDTVKLYAPYLLFETYPDVVKVIDENVTSASDSIGVWTAAVPRRFIEDNVISLTDDGSYHFTNEDDTEVIGVEVLEKIWSNMVTLTTHYFPIFILLTTPFLALLMRLLFGIKKSSRLKNFVFSLHYISYLEVLIILIYVLHLIASPPIWLMQWLILIVSSVYLTIAIRKVYDTEKWHTTICKAIIANFGYVMILFVLFFIIFITSVVLVTYQFYA